MGEEGTGFEIVEMQRQVTFSGRGFTKSSDLLDIRRENKVSIEDHTEGLHLRGQSQETRQDRGGEGQ